MATKADKWNQRYAGSELIWSATPNPFFAELAAGLEPGRALDLACGEGRNALWLAEQGWQVTAVDFSSVGIEKAQKVAEKRDLQVDFKVMDVTQLNEQASFELVSVVYLHTSEDEREIWLARAISAVKPGGYLIYVGHDPENIEHGTGGPQDPTVLPSVAELSDRLVDFEILTGEVRKRQVTADTGHGGSGDTALDTVLIGKRL